MHKTKLEFNGHQGKLSGLLESPKSQPKAYVLFAHCFTCGKDFIAASHISRALVALDFAVFRFDFTGLGNSDGDFANTNFSSNVEDLIAAADFLKQNYQAPKLLIGHSLGGAAILKAAKSIPESKAVVTIAAPANASHIKHLIDSKIDDIKQEGEANIDLAGRTFKIKKQFLEDLDSQNTNHIKSLDKALLVLHSPLDDTVAIQEAEKIYTSAKHPKSFISLDTANHLLTNRIDANYAAKLIASWSEKFLETERTRTKSKSIRSGQVRVEEKDHKFQCIIETSSHKWIADEPLKVGGTNLGPDPYEHLLAALGSCTVMTLRMYANLKDIPMKNVIVNLSHNKEHGEDCKACDDNHKIVDVIHRDIEFEGELSMEQVKKLLVIADKCPVHKTLHNKIEVRTKLKA